ncbi:TetR/AcrR family transcriptional regulator [Paenibacillus athensensis]|nr:TetR/AcrR family transcriptional regulator [Paenibacillus athensensis]MCD1261682.1 TetR/AcrR family transcriptional regulator [Paenibacillus athensensis]
MSMTKQEIVRSASKLFSLRGFGAVSIQDIADDCRIAKGSVYKYFPSKEDLFGEVMEQFLNRYFAEAERMARLPGLSAKAHFVQQLEFRFRYFMEHKHILIEYSGSLRQNDKFIPLRLRTRGRLMQWHKELLERVYGGLELAPYIWDLVFVYKALLKEFLQWVMAEHDPLPIDRTARFVLERLDAVAAHFQAAGGQPLLGPADYARYLHWGAGGDSAADRARTAAELLEQLSAAVAELPVGGSEQAELLELLRLLRVEAAKERPSGPLLRALVAYVEREPQLQSLAAQLRNVLAL